MRWRRWGRLAWRLEAKAQDCWVGAYLATRPGPAGAARHAWLCLVPMVPLHLVLAGRPGPSASRPVPGMGRYTTPAGGMRASRRGGAREG